MKVSVKEKKTEAIERMKLLNIYPETIQQFEKESLVSISVPPIGAFYWIDEEMTKIIRNFEDTYNLLFYVAVRAYFKEIGKMDAFLFVSDYKDKEWEYDRQDLKRGQAMAYVHNYDVPMFSEFGLIGIKPTIAAGLQRIW